MVTTAMAVSSSISSGSSARPGSAALLVSGRTAAPLAPRGAVQRTGRLSRKGDRGSGEPRASRFRTREVDPLQRTASQVYPLRAALPVSYPGGGLTGSSLRCAKPKSSSGS